MTRMWLLWIKKPVPPSGKVSAPKRFYDKLEPVFRKSYQTPIIIEVNGKEQLISNSSFMCFAHDVNTGEVIWTMEYGFDSTVSQPLYWNGLVFVNSGWIFEDNKPYFTREYAIDPTGKGDVTKTHVKWMYQEWVSSDSHTRDCWRQNVFCTRSRPGILYRCCNCKTNLETGTEREL